MQVLRFIVQNSNRSQDLELRSRADQLEANGFQRYSMELLDLVGLKYKIESTIHSGENVSVRGEELDTLVDSIVFGAADQLEKLASIDQRIEQDSNHKLPPDVQQHLQKTQANIREQLADAQQTIRDTWENLGAWIDPADLPSSSHERLDEAIAHLKSECELVNRVQNRLDSDWVTQFPEDR